VGWPLAKDIDASSVQDDIDSHQAPRTGNFVESEARHAFDTTVQSGMMMSKEADPRSRASNRVIQSLDVADPSSTSPVRFKGHPGWRVVQQQHIETSTRDEHVDL
jgi:hypothetical protein